MQKKPFTLVWMLIAAAALVAVGFLTAPSWWPSKDSAVTDVVLAYNRLLAEGYRQKNMTGLYAVATDNQAYTEYIHMSSLAEGGRTLESTQTAVEFLNVSMSEEGSATVETREQWVYTQVGPSGVVVVPETEVEYELTYELSLLDGQWKVNWVFETANPRRPAEEQQAPSDPSGQ